MWNWFREYFLNCEGEEDSDIEKVWADLEGSISITLSIVMRDGSTHKRIARIHQDDVGSWKDDAIIKITSPDNRWFCLEDSDDHIDIRLFHIPDIISVSIKQMPIFILYKGEKARNKITQYFEDNKDFS